MLKNFNFYAKNNPQTELKNGMCVFVKYVFSMIWYYFKDLEKAWDNFLEMEEVKLNLKSTKNWVWIISVYNTAIFDRIYFPNDPTHDNFFEVVCRFYDLTCARQYGKISCPK